MRSRLVISSGIQKAAVLIVITFAIYCRLSQPDITWFNTHMARDFARSLEWLNFHPRSLLGPEMNSGVRLYGPAFYWLIALAWTATHSLPGMLVLLHSITILLSLYFCWLIREDLGKSTAALFFLQFFLMPVHVMVSRTLWNPSAVLPISLAILILVRGYVKNPEDSRRLIGIFVMGCLGVQMHHSALAAVVSAVLVIYWNTRRLKEIGIGVVSLALYLGVVGWSASSGVGHSAAHAAFLWQDWVAKAGGIAHYLVRWNYHLFLTEQPLRHYELFPLIFNLGKTVAPFDTGIILAFTKIVRAIFLATFVVSAGFFTFSLLTKLWRRLPFDLYEQIAVVGSVVSVGSLFFYLGNGETLPYRYGLMWYPVQFLVIPLALRNLKLYSAMARFPRLELSFRSGAAALCAITFCGNAYFLLTAYHVMAATGRISHVVTDTAEIPLRDKLELLKKVRTSENGPSSFATFHGPIANKMFAMDTDMQEMEYYGALINGMARTPALAKAATNEYYVDSFSLEEMKRNYETSQPELPLHLITLTKEDLPYDIKAQYFGAANQLIAERNFLTHEMILPFKDPLNTPPLKLVLSFKVARKGNEFLRICFDEGRGFSALAIRGITVNGAPGEVRLNSSEWLEQRTAILSLAPVHSDEALIQMSFLVNSPESRFSRVDIFKTASGLFRYENASPDIKRSLVWRNL